MSDTPPITTWPLPEQLVLLVGCPRSGVSFAASQLAQHPSALLLDGDGVADAWLDHRLHAPHSRPTTDLQEAVERALAPIYDHPPPPPGPNKLILPLPGLLSNGARLQALLGGAPPTAAPALQLVELVRERPAVVDSLARFPHLCPELPDPWADPAAFQLAAEQLWDHCRGEAEQLRQRGWLVHQVTYEALVHQGPAALWSVLGLPPPEPQALLQPHGISPTLCFRERRPDLGGLQPPPATAPAPVPWIATGRGGSGTRLLTLLLQDLGVHLGHSLNPTGDSVEWADLIYELSLASLSGHPQPWRGQWRDALQHRARCVAPAQDGSQPWAWKLPEAMLVLPQLTATWPHTPIIHLVRDPIDTCLRRCHMTSRLNNPIGRATLQAAFSALGLSDNPSEAPAYWRNAVSWWYQLELLQRCKADTAARGQTWIELRYEDVCSNPQDAAHHLATALNLPHRPVSLPLNPQRSQAANRDDPRAAHIWELCGSIAERYGYRRERS